MVVMRSCCCCSMKSGSILIAVLYMLFTGLVLLGLGLMLAYFNDSFRPYVVTVINNLPSDQLNSALTTAVESSITTTRNVIIAGLILNAIYFFLCLLLFVGGVKECSGYLIPWLVGDFIRQLLFFSAFVFLAWFTGCLVAKGMTDYGVLIIHCVLMLIIVALTFYFWLAIVASSQEFRDREQQISPEETKQPFPPNGDSFIIYDE